MTASRLVLLLAAGACAPAPPAEPRLLLYGGKVFTAIEGAPWAEAVLIRGERIERVGTTAELRAAAGDAEAIDLAGKTVIPGFNDAHQHVTPARPAVAVATGGEGLPDPSFEVVRDSLAAAAGRTPAGTWLTVSVGERILSDPRARREALDRIAPGHPVRLEAWSGHGTILNGAGLAALGLGDSVADPLGGRYQRRDGRLTGLLEEYAGFDAMTRVAAAEDSAVIAAFRTDAAHLIQWGVTSIQNFLTSIRPEAIRRIADSLDLPVRVRLIRFPLTTAAGRDLAGWRALPSGRIGRLEISGTKYVLDGTPVERLATFRAPYADRAGWRGRLNFPPDTLRAILEEAVAAGEQPLIHAVGDSAIGLLLRTMERVAPDSVWQRLRPRLEHGEGLLPEWFPLARRLGVVLVQNPSHLALGPMIAARYGPGRAAVVQPLKSALAAGIPVAIGSDGPLNPFLNLMFAVLHPNNPKEALTMEEAVRAYTAGSAFAEHREHEKGRIAPGMLADLAVLSQDIFTVPPATLPATTAVMTIVGGRTRS